MPRTLSERTLLFLVGAVQFVNILDFMMVMPLGPDFAAGLGIPASQLGLVGGAYTGAAAVSGLLGATFLDRFDRRRALAAAMVGLVLATAAGGVATGFGTMVAARLMAGFFGGPATSLSLSIVADVVPAERRGRALGAVMGAFSVASVLGVPAGLELARLGSWRTPFFAVAGLGLLVAGGALWLMPPMTGHLDRARALAAAAEGGVGPAGGVAPAAAKGLLSSPAALFSLSATATAMLSGFAVIPNIAAHVQVNLGYPRDRLGVVYMVGGAVAFFSMRAAGRAVDRFGAPAISAAGTAIFVAVMAFGFAWPPPWVPVVTLFVFFMLGNSTRNVAMNTLASRVPAPEERARFMSVQSAVQHLAAALGAVLSTRLLTVQPDGRLGGMTTLAVSAAVVSMAQPPLLLAVSRRLVRRKA